MRKMLTERIKQIRTELEISQEELARCLGVSYRTILRWEQGETEPRGMLKDRVLNWLTKEEISENFIFSLTYENLNDKR